MWKNQDLKPRTVNCGRCGKPQTEKVYGEGFLGWIRLPEYLNEKGSALILCPNCNAILKKWLNGGKDGNLD
jgi:hypothetical protein